MVAVINIKGGSGISRQPKVPDCDVGPGIFDILLPFVDFIFTAKAEPIHELGRVWPGNDFILMVVEVERLVGKRHDAVTMTSFPLLIPGASIGKDFDKGMLPLLPLSSQLAGEINGIQ